MGRCETTAWRAMSGFTYVYTLVSSSDPSCHYTGLTDDLRARLRVHNAGGCPHTSKHRPWTIETAVAFRSREKAAAFERYCPYFPLAPGRRAGP